MNIPMGDMQQVVDYCWLDNLTNYNDFFHPNICHICKRTNNGNLISCNKCHMISYCSDEHKQKHYPEHMRLCKCISEYIRKEKGEEWLSLSTTTNLWLESRYKFLIRITVLLGRDLTLYEKQMFFFAKTCFICHKQINLRPCQICYSANFCNDHTIEFQNRHALKCQKLVLYINLNIIQLSVKKFSLTHFSSSESVEFIDNMNSFIINCVRDPSHRGLESWTSLEYLYSDYVSGPLTLYDGMKKANLLDLLNMTKPQCIIHVIAAGPTERNNVLVWELLLHYLTYIKHLTIVLIGLELEAESSEIQVCEKCTRLQQKLKFVCHPVLYDEYVNSLLFQQPNVIIVFEACFKMSSLFRNSVLEARKMNCPYLLTAGSQLLAKQNINVIKKFINVNPVYNGKSNFESLRPWRPLFSDDISYHNSYVTVYRHLLTSKKPFQAA